MIRYVVQRDSSGVGGGEGVLVECRYSEEVSMRKPCQGSYKQMRVGI